jgi:heme-degrading monooxygenase HmoA
MFCWMTARRIRSGQMAEFRTGWEWSSEPRPAGLVHSYFLQDTQDENRMIGLSIWLDRTAYEAYVKTESEAGRREAMSSQVEAIEEERFFEMTEHNY